MGNLTLKSKATYTIIFCLVLIMGIIVAKKVIRVSDTKNLTPVEFAKKYNN